jgi:hypothetical protein
LDLFNKDSLGKSGDWDNSIGGNSWLFIVYKGFREYADSKNNFIKKWKLTLIILKLN